MSTFIHLMPETLAVENVPAETMEAASQEAAPARALDRELESFAEEQIRTLVRSVYLAQSKPSRQVVFSAVDRQAGISQICRRVAEALSADAPGTTCLLDASKQDQGAAGEDGLHISSDQKRFGHLRDSSLQLSSNLWYMPRDVFHGEPRSRASNAWLKSRLAELRLEFDHLVIQAPAAAATNEAALLARLCDGLVLVLVANSTRRASAIKIKQTLDAAHVRLLGTVLSERTFPIPRAIYSRV